MDKREYSRSYAANNRERIRAKNKRWNAAHPELVQRYQREYYHKAKTAILVYKQDYYSQHREEIRSAQALQYRRRYFRIYGMINKKHLTNIGFRYNVTSDRPYECRFCGKSYKDEGDWLFQHGDTHIKELAEERNSMNTKQNGNFVNENEYTELKKQFTPGVNITKLSTKTGRSWHVLHLIRDTESWDEFQQARSDYHHKKHNYPKKAVVSKKLSEEKYNEVKELVFRGEYTVEIAARVHVSTETIRRIKLTKSYAEYIQLSWKHFSHQSAPPPQAQKQPEVNHYWRLNEFRAGLDAVLIDFINTEIGLGNKELLRSIDVLQKENEELQGDIDLSKIKIEALERENKRLNQANDALMRRINALETPNFTKALREQLAAKEEHRGI